MGAEGTGHHRRNRTVALTAVLALAAAAVVVAVTRPSKTSASAGQTRTYYIAADPVDWDYAPSGKNLLGAHFEGDAGTFLDHGDDRIGHVDRKSVYRAYTDDHVKTLAPRPKDWEHLGMLARRSTPRSVTPSRSSSRTTRPTRPASTPRRPLRQGVGGGRLRGRHDRQGQGRRRRPRGRDPHLHLGGAGAGRPGPHDEELGPVGLPLPHRRDHRHQRRPHRPLIVTRKGMAKADGSPRNVDHEVVTLFNIYDENLSPWLDWNIGHHTGKPKDVKKDDAEFKESNLKHSINGYLFGNLPGLDVKRGERVRWYVFGSGTETGLHTPHWHGNTVVSMGQRMDMLDILPMTMKTADMVPDAPGQWLFHCHVNDHIAGGMAALYRVQ